VLKWRWIQVRQERVKQSSNVKEKRRANATNQETENKAPHSKVAEQSNTDKEPDTKLDFELLKKIFLTQQQA
jgi:hypothetical protein